MDFEEWFDDLVITCDSPSINLYVAKDLLHRAYDAGYYCAESKKQKDDVGE